MPFNVIMPEMGEGVIEGTVARWLKNVGDEVAKFEPILEIETDKVTTEAVAEEAGTLTQIMVPEGETVAVGTVLAVIGGSGAPVAVEPIAEAQPVVEAAVVAAPPAKRANGGQPRRSLGRISPVVGRMADEHDLDLTQIIGTGRNGRITKKDVLAYLKDRDTKPEVVAPAPKPTPQPAPTPTPIVVPPVTPPRTPAPTPLPAPMANDTLVPLTSMRRAIADHMVMSKRTSPHVTTVFEADFSAIMAHRKAHKAAFAQSGVKLTFTPYIIIAIARALREHPLVNSSWSDEGIVQKRDVNIGMATAIDSGLIVPVIKNADELNLMGMARRVNDLAERARSNRLQPTEVQGGTFTLTNHGTSGSLFATPIINQPQTGILGVGKIEKRVVVVDDMIAIRPKAYVSLTFDHRVLDGKSADDFTAAVVNHLENLG